MKKLFKSAPSLQLEGQWWVVGDRQLMACLRLPAGAADDPGPQHQAGPFSIWVTQHTCEDCKMRPLGLCSQWKHCLSPLHMTQGALYVSLKKKKRWASPTSTNVLAKLKAVHGYIRTTNTWGASILCETGWTPGGKVPTSPLPTENHCGWTGCFILFWP